MEMIIPQDPEGMLKLCKETLQKIGKDITVNERINYLNMIVDCYNRMQKFNKAIKYAKRVYKILLDMQILGAEGHLSIAMMESNMACLHKANKNRDAAREWVKKAWERVKQYRQEKNSIAIAVDTVLEKSQPGGIPPEQENFIIDQIQSNYADICGVMLVL